MNLILQPTTETLHGFYSFMLIAFHAMFMLTGLSGDKRLYRREKKILIFGFVFRLLLLTWDRVGRSIFAFPDVLDSLTFEFTAASYFDGIIQGRGGFYASCLNALYHIVGPQPIFGQYLNVVMSVCAAEVIVLLLNKMDLHPRAVNAAAVFMCLMPYLAIDNSLLLRESAIQFLLAVSLYYFYSWIISGNRRQLMLSFVYPCLAALFHSGAIAVILGYAAGVILYNRKNHRIEVNIRSIFMLLAVVAVFLIGNAAFGDAVLSKFGNIDDVSDVVRAASSHTAGGSSYSIGTDVTGLGGLIRYTPLRMLYFLASPVPWQWRNATDMVSFVLSAFPYVWIILNALRIGRRSEYNRPQIAIAILTVLASAAMFAWGVSNAGAAMRHRDKFVAVYAVLLALSMDVKYMKAYIDQE